MASLLQKCCKHAWVIYTTLRLQRIGQGLSPWKALCSDKSLPPRSEHVELLYWWCAELENKTGQSPSSRDEEGMQSMEPVLSANANPSNISFFNGSCLCCLRMTFITLSPTTFLSSFQFAFFFFPLSHYCFYFPSFLCTWQCCMKAFFQTWLPPCCMVPPSLCHVLETISKLQAGAVAALPSFIFHISGITILLSALHSEIHLLYFIWFPPPSG